MKESPSTPQNNGDNKHGTRCAGEVSGGHKGAVRDCDETFVAFKPMFQVAAVAFNDYCGVGVAYNASIGGEYENENQILCLFPVSNMLCV